MKKTPLFLCMEKTDQFTRFGLEDGCEAEPSLPIRAVCHYSSSPSCDSGCCDDFWIVDSEGEVFVSGGGDYWRYYDLTEDTDTLNGTLQSLREAVAAVYGVTNTRVVAGMYRPNENYFFARRSGDRAHSGCWEVPGGKVEPDETDEQALIREYEEELGLSITVGKLLCGFVCNGIHIFLYEVFAPDGSKIYGPKPGIHDQYIFVNDLHRFIAALDSGCERSTPSTKPFAEFLLNQSEKDESADFTAKAFFLNERQEL